MAIPELPDLHDACLESFQLGPRRELSLALALVPGGASASLRFGAIENFEAVSAFFAGLSSPPQGVYIDRIEQLGYSRVKGSSAKLLHIDFVLDHAGPVSISCRKVAFQREPAA